MEDMMRDWICSSTHDKPADVYVFGFQEIVPLNARNVIVSENNKISMKWNSLIRAALNKKIPTVVEKDNIVGEIQKVYPIKDDSSSANSVGSRSNRHEFGCIISKQMIGIFLIVWVRSDLRQCIRNLSVSCVGCGLMSYLGNKGSVSIRFWLHGTSFCFVCTHLASGGTEGDERRRNANVSQILSNTSFPSGPSHNLPRKIIDHEYAYT
ncbi:Endonuclease/exonuclease/phosphatase [Parasponia andersonii]|uniref:Endonuclease/exonuclease/phosphatase n=1 Tax=Parasponia andersonii TaxID=3476 RepID=A0A2P5AXH8_PARAD|nr:Endonuclease/exonuclease/phosphatase [Parasponia andersonii]